MNIREKELFELSKLIQSEENYSNLEKDLLHVLIRGLNATYCFYAVYNDILDEINIQKLVSFKNNILRTEKVTKSKIEECDCIYHACVQDKNLSNLGELNNSIEKCNIKIIDTKIESIMSIPLIHGGKLIGLLAAINKIESKDFNSEDEKFISIFSIIFSLYLENQKLREENITKDRLSKLGQSIINSAHGLKNLLNNIDGGVYIVERGTLKKNMVEVTKGWEILRRNSNRVRDLVLDILLFSRPKKPDFKLCNVNEICKDLKELLQKNVDDSNIEIILNLDSSLKPMYLDPKGIYRSILNLVSNAISACEEKQSGRITIRTKLIDSKHVQITVADTGSGISKENLDNIFDTFFTTKGSKGTGLGLSVTQKIIRDHKGTIDVKSLLNIGTTFTIRIPLLEPNNMDKEDLV